VGEVLEVDVDHSLPEEDIVVGIEVVVEGGSRHTRLKGLRRCWEFDWKA
jgi:hypothetical protein